MLQSLRLASVAAVFGLAVVVSLPIACTNPSPEPGVSMNPFYENRGELGQACFPGDTCSPGLTCIAEAVQVEEGGMSEGTDGGQCLCVEEAGCGVPAAGDAEVEAGDAAAPGD